MLFHILLQFKNYLEVVCFFSLIPICITKSLSKKLLIDDSNWTEWSTIQGVIVRVISKSDECEARGRFEMAEFEISELKMSFETSF